MTIPNKNTVNLLNGSTNVRVETDSLGQKEIPANAVYGIHTQRALENFDISGRPVNINLIYEIVTIKKAAALTHLSLGQFNETLGNAILYACDEILEGNFDDAFVTDALQGGAGTSTNMNVNEVIANVAIKKLGGHYGDYHIIHPLNDVNLSQSTNDVYPTAIRIAAIKRLRRLSEEFAKLQTSFQRKETEFADIIKLGRTQLMDALPIMVGQEFGAYAQAIARDRWRLYKVEERLRQTNLGGTAIGTGMNAHRQFIFTLTDIIRDLTNIGLARAEFPIDLTQNNDVFVEVSGLLKAAAVNLIKISNDLRLLNSGPRGGFSEISLEAVQAGSSIMPGKVNPVIPEMMITTCIKVIANDTAITTAAAYGNLELNSFTPIIADSLLESLEILEKAIKIFREKCIETLRVNEEVCLYHLERSTALATALTAHIGYDAAANIAKAALKTNRTIKEVALEQTPLTKEQLDTILNPYQVTKPGIPG
jgi:aspartate ammonia-lyase